MAFEKERWEERFRTLSTRYGGSLLKEKGKLPQNNKVVVFIGLGGLGGMAVNAIKATATERLSDPDNRFYLVVDTCRSDMNDISVPGAQDISAEDIAQGKKYLHGCIEADEKMTLYKETYEICSLGPHIDSWINRSVMGHVQVDDRGAQGKRQVGRVMLFGDLAEYDNNVNKLRDLLTKAQNVASAKNLDMKIYIIAGVGGGTGSGTVVDFTYMVRKAIERFPLAHRKVEGIIFTPDVQENDISTANYYKNTVCRNFYAAMKEIDYYFNNRARGKAYVCPVGMQEEVYKEDIFDECTLVSRLSSGVQIASNAAGVIQKLAEAIVFELGGIKGELSNGTKNQSYDSFYSNLHAHFDSWWKENMGDKGLKMPDFLPYRYSSLGYASFYIPRDELVAYCANRLVEHLIDQWTKNDVRDEDIDALMKKAHLFDYRQFAAKLFESSGAEDAFSDIDEREKPKDGPALLPVKNCAKYLELMQEIARQESASSAVTKKLGKAEKTLSADFVDIILKEVDEAFTSQTGKGPVYAINLLSANSIHRKGVLRRLAAMLDGTTGEADDWMGELKKIYQHLQKKAEEYDGKVSMPPADLASFTASCESYAKSYVMAALLRKSKDLLDKIYDELNSKNNRVFEIYTWTFDFLKDMLKKDSSYVLSTQRRKEGHVTTFTFDLADFGQNDPLSNFFREYFDSYVDGKDMDKMSQEFIHGIFGAMKDLLDPADKKPGEVQPEQVIAILRKFFTGAFSEFTSQAIEKFCVIAYGDTGLTPEQLTALFNRTDDDSKQQLSQAFQSAANKIETRLRDAKIMLSSSDQARSVERFHSYKAVYGLEETKDINAKFDNPPTILPAEWSEFISYRRIFGFPIALLDKLRQYRDIYNRSTGNYGVHLDEVEDDWRYAFPNLYDYNIAHFENAYVATGEDVVESDKQRMEKILTAAKKAKALGLLEVISTVVAPASGDGEAAVAKAEDSASIAAAEARDHYALTYQLLRPLKDNEELIRSKLASVILENPELSFLQTLSAAGYAPGTPVEIQWCFNATEYDVIGQINPMTDFGDDVDFGNFITLIRSNYEWEQKLNCAVNLFSRFFGIYESVKKEMEVKLLYDRRTTTFVQTIMSNLLTPYSNPTTGKFSGFQLKIGDREADTLLFKTGTMVSIDKKMGLYLFFTEFMMKLDEEKFKHLRQYLQKVKEKLQDDAEGLAAAKTNVEWFQKHIAGVLADDYYLGNEYQSEILENFKEGLEDSAYGYNVPAPSNDRKDVNTVIENLRSFYKNLKKKIERELQAMEE